MKETEVAQKDAETPAQRPKRQKRSEQPKEEKNENPPKRQNPGKEEAEGDGEAKRGRWEGEPKTFARRNCPANAYGKAKWMALKAAFLEKIKPNLQVYSAHEDYKFLAWGG